MSGRLDGSEKQFFGFLESYRGLIKRHIPGNFFFEYDVRPYMLPVLRQLELLVGQLPAGSKVLDLGCGRGHFGAYLARRGLKVSGLEIRSPRPTDDLFCNQERGSIRRYQSLWRESAGLYGCRCAYFDGRRIPLKSASLDAVLFYASYEHILLEDVPAVTAEAFRVLKPGGKAYIFRCPSRLAWTEWLANWLGLGHHDKLYGKREILGLLQGAGFELREFRRTDFFLSHFSPAQGLLNRLTGPLLALEKLLAFTPLIFFFHHFEIVLQKPGGPK